MPASWPSVCGGTPKPTSNPPRREVSCLAFTEGSMASPPLLRPCSPMIRVLAPRPSHFALKMPALQPVKREFHDDEGAHQ